MIGRCLRQLGELEGDAGERATCSEAVELLARVAGAARARPRARRARRRAAPRRAGRPTRASRCARRSSWPRRAAARRSSSRSAPSCDAAGARPRTAALGGVESLTARELRVATLAADGRTNREIAQALYVTPKTVEVHLSSAYRKLDIRSRRDLVGALGAGPDYVA